MKALFIPLKVDGLQPQPSPIDQALEAYADAYRAYLAVRSEANAARARKAWAAYCALTNEPGEAGHEHR